MIKFIREYEFYGSTWYDIIYTDGKFITRVRTVLEPDLPKTARRYIAGAKREEHLITEHGKTRNEIIYCEVSK